MNKIEGINLKEVIEECREALSREKEGKKKLEKIWAEFWAEKAIESHNHILATCNRSQPAGFYSLDMAEIKSEFEEEYKWLRP